MASYLRLLVDRDVVVIRGRAARAHPAAGWLDGHDGPVPGYRMERVHSGMGSAISTDAAADQGQAAGGLLVPDRMRPVRGRSGARSSGRCPEPGNAGLRRSGCCPFRRVPQRRLGPEPAWGTCWVRGIKSGGPVDVPPLMPGLPHSAEPQRHIRHGVFSRLLTFTARRPAAGSGVMAAARRTAARWPRSGSWRRSGRRQG